MLERPCAPASHRGGGRADREELRFDRRQGRRGGLRARLRPSPRPRSHARVRGRGKARAMKGPWTLPNFITLLRLAMLPFFLVAIANGRFDVALALFVAAGISDGV